MKSTKQTICMLMVFFFIVSLPIFGSGASAAGSPQEKCPVMAGNIDKNTYVDYQGKRIYFCCSGCLDEFKKDPGKYMKTLEEQGVVLEDAPKAN